MNSPKRTISAYRMLLVCLTILTSSVLLKPGDAQQREENPAYTRYRRVLDLVFPKTVSGSLVIVLRFAPVGSPDTQIILSHKLDGSYEITQFLLKDKKSIAVKVADIFEKSGITDPQEIARHIEVNIKTVKVERETAERWIATFSELKLSPLLETHTTLDGTHYALWLSTHTSREMHFSFVGPDSADGSSSNPIIRWMNQVRTEAEKLVGLAASGG